MAETGAITAAQAQAAAAQIDFPPQADDRRGLVRRLGGRAGASRCCRRMPTRRCAPRSTPGMQAVAEARLAAMLDGPGAAAGVGQGAVVVLDAATGAVRAMVGGRDSRESPFNRAVLARRQPGSAFKPFVWLAALEKGVRPDDTVLDAPMRSATGARPISSSATSARSPWRRRWPSRSTPPPCGCCSRPAGRARWRRWRAGSGSRTSCPNNASLALGTGEVGLLELAAAYAAFFNGGQRVAPYAVEQLSSGRRTVAAGHAPPEQVIDPEQAAMMARMLAAVVARGTGRAAAVPGAHGRRQDRHDAGFSRCLVHRLRSTAQSSGSGSATTTTAR